MKRQQINPAEIIGSGKAISTKEKIKLVGRLSLPSIIAQITSILMQYIDAGMVGSLGAAASASIGLVSSTTWLFGGMCFALSSGFSVQVAQLVGAGRKKEAKHVFCQALIAALVFSLALAAIGIAVSGKLPVWLGAEEGIREDASRYFLIYAGFIPVMQLTYLAGQMLQCSGNMRVPGILNACMCLLDILLNAIFIFPAREVAVFGTTVTVFGAGLGVAGAALGTVLSELIIGILMMFAACVRSPYLKFERGTSWRLTKDCLKKAAKIALPMGGERVALNGAMILITRIIAPLGTVAIAANSFAVTAESLCYMPGYGIEEASTTLVGQSVGAGRKDLTRSFAWITVFMGMAIMAAMGVLMYFAAPMVFEMLTPNEEVRELGTRILRIEVLAEPLFGASIVASGALRGAGDTFIPGLMNLASIWGVRLTLSAALVSGFGLVGVWIAMCTELCFRGAIFLFRLKQEKWMKKTENWREPDAV